MNRRALVAVAVVGALLAGGAFAALRLSDDDPESGGAGGPGVPRVDDPGISVPDSRVPEDATTSTASGAAVPLGSIRIKATQVATASKPVDLATRAGDDTLYVAEQGGRVRAVSGGSATTVLDISDEVSTGTEQGLLGLEFSPDGSYLYANFTDRNGDTHVIEWTMRDDGPDAGSRREVLEFGQPFPNHNGGGLAFGPDNFLYVATGDGGSGGDPEGNAQRLDTLLGKILRIHPRPTGNSPYAVPSTNPFVDTPGARGEIWAYGLRNPWRISFDAQTGDLWIADVGQGTREEISVQPARSPGGQNYGWNRLEGTKPFQGTPPTSHVAPLYEYATGEDGACAVTGGYVYRGDRIPALRGVYVFADACQGRVMGLRADGGNLTDRGALGPVITGQPYAISSFGEDASGEVYVLSLAGGIYRLDPA